MCYMPNLGLLHCKNNLIILQLRGYILVTTMIHKLDIIWLLKMSYMYNIKVQFLVFASSKISAD